MVDLHISQIRPNLKEKSYIPAKFNQLCTLSGEYLWKNLDEKFYDFYHGYPKERENKWVPSHYIAFEKEKAELEELRHKALHSEGEHDHDSDEEHHASHDVEWTED